VPTTRPIQDEVKDHYRTLATQYNDRANQACERSYRRVVRRVMGGARLLELGGGSTDLLDSLGRPVAVACDLSAEMLLMRPGGAGTHRVVAVGERLPFADAAFDGLFSINVLEHVADLVAVVAESARVLDEGGTFLAITPNGNWESGLDLAERWGLKIPEGPHAFLTTRRLAEAARRHFTVVEHRTFLVLPAGPPGLTALVDRATAASALGWGFFQYLVAQKPRAAAAARP